MYYGQIYHTHQFKRPPNHSTVRKQHTNERWWCMMERIYKKKHLYLQLVARNASSTTLTVRLSPQATTNYDIQFFVEKQFPVGYLLLSCKCYYICVYKKSYTQTNKTALRRTHKILRMHFRMQHIATLKRRQKERERECELESVSGLQFIK